jgi:hypothetical protein
MSDVQPVPVKTAAETANAAKIETAIERWFNTHIADSPVARAVDAYNHLRSVLGRLSADLADITKEI